MPRMGGHTPTDHASRHQDGGRDEINIADLSGTPAALTTHAADLDAHTKDQLEILRTGEYYYWPDVGAPSGGAVAGNILYAQILVVPRDITIDRIAIDVTTEEAAKKIRLGIYENGTNLYPGALLVDAGEVSVASTGVKAITIDQALTKGIYWLACVTDASSLAIYKILHTYNFMPLAGLRATDFNPATSWAVAHTYAALPDPFTAGGTLQYARYYLIPVRVASLD